MEVSREQKRMKAKENGSKNRKRRSKENESKNKKRIEARIKRE